MGISQSSYGGLSCKLVHHRSRIRSWRERFPRGLKNWQMWVHWGTTRLVEELEHLEEEAITGDDEGRDPTDYNRRAHIFDKSSQVFQANKDHDTRSNSDRSI